MAFLRFTRDRRGFENTFLLHASHPGERPRILYWYRSAPGVRVGRPALDEDAIRTIEEQHPEVDFDWPQILEVGAITQPEIERRPVRQKRKPPSPAPMAGEEQRAAAREPRPEAAESRAAAEPTEMSEAGLDESVPGDASAESDRAIDIMPPDADAFVDDQGDEEPPAAVPLSSRGHDLLEQLVGREIATRLHARYAEILGRVHRLPIDHPHRDAWQIRAAALNPDNWVTPDEILRGVQTADALFDSLRRDLLS